MSMSPAETHRLTVDNLRRLRHRAGFNQFDFARRMGATLSIPHEAAALGIPPVRLERSLKAQGAPVGGDAT